MDGAIRLQIVVDQNETVEIGLSEATARTSIEIAKALSPAAHQVQIEIVEGAVWFDSYLVKSRSSLLFNRLGSTLMVMATLIGLWVIWQRRHET